MQHQSVSLFYSIVSFLLLYFCAWAFCLIYVLSVESHLQSRFSSLALVHSNCDIDIRSIYLHPLPLGGYYCFGYIAAFPIAMFLVTSHIVINVPTRGLLAVETLHAIVQWLANLNIKRNMTSMFVNKNHG